MAVVICVFDVAW